MQTDRPVLTIQLTPELQALLAQVREEHPALSRHALARAALALGLTHAIGDHDALCAHVGTHWAQATTSG